MDETIRLGRIAGIAVGVNWSVLIVAGLIAFGLATETFPLLSPDQSAGTYWVAAIVTASLFFACLLAHEMGHSLVARRHGVQVQAITLWMLGGVAKLEGEAPAAEDELKITAIGPAVSIALGMAFGVLGFVFGALGLPDIVVAVPIWLATINVILAVFNLIPAFPLDGGRVLRALLWRHSGDRLAATRTAAAVGRSFGYAFIGLGLFGALSGVPSGLWFAFIGVFIVFASGMEATQLEQRELLSGLTAADVMTPHPITAPAAISVQQLIDEHVLRHHVSAYPLLDAQGRLCGLATLASLRAVPADQRDRTPVLAAAVPLDAVSLVDLTTPLEQVVALLAGSTERRVLVVHDAMLEGIVSGSDIVRALEIRDLARRPSGPSRAGSAVRPV